MGMFDRANSVSSITFWASRGARVSSSSTKLRRAALLVMGPAWNW